MIEPLSLDIEPYHQVINCPDCKANFNFKGRREIRYCPYCARDCKPKQIDVVELIHETREEQLFHGLGGE